MIALLIAAALLFAIVFAWAYSALEWASKPVQTEMDGLRACLQNEIKTSVAHCNRATQLDLQLAYASQNVGRLEREVAGLRTQEVSLQLVITQLEDQFADLMSDYEDAEDAESEAESNLLESDELLTALVESITLDS